MERTINRIAKELAWTVGNAVLDSGNDELVQMTLSQLISIRCIIEEETNQLLKDMMDKNKDVYELIQRI